MKDLKYGTYHPRGNHTHMWREQVLGNSNKWQNIWVLKLAPRESLTAELLTRYSEWAMTDRLRSYMLKLLSHIIGSKNSKDFQSNSLIAI